jgi:glycosyltransferase involved in cell wall biosynthesis
MHICMISAGTGHGGGLERVVQELTQVLTKKQIQLTVYNIGSKDLTKVSEGCTFEELRPYNLLPHKLTFSLYEKYSYSLKVWRKISSHNSFDIIHGHGDNCFFPALFRDKTPFVFNMHGVKRAYYYRLAGPNSRILKNPRSFPLFWPEEIAAKKSDLVVACSKSERDELIFFYDIDPKKIKVIYNGVDSEKFKPMDKQTARKILGLPENRNYAIWVGNSPTLKGLTTAIKAVKNIKNLSLLVVGLSGINFGNVIFWGMVEDHQKLLALYNAANFLILPTLYEGFPLVPMEAMACGLPILISKECPTREIIHVGLEGYIVDQNKPEFYAEKIEKLLSYEFQNPEVSIQCRNLVEQYSWINVGQEYVKVYSHLKK